VKMGRKSKNSSFNKRQLVIFHYKKDKLYREIDKLINLSKSMVADIVKRYVREDRIESIPQKGRPKLLDSRDKHKIIGKIKVNPGLSTRKLTSELYEKINKKVQFVEH